MTGKHLKVSVKQTLAGGCFNRIQMEQIAGSLIVELPGCLRLVQYSPTAPPDTTLPWQQTDDCGGAPIGTVKTFRSGAWV